VDEIFKEHALKDVACRWNCRPALAEGFFDHVLRNEESYEEKWHYVRENPVRAGLVKDREEWPFWGEIFDLRYHSD